MAGVEAVRVLSVLDEAADGLKYELPNLMVPISEDTSSSSLRLLYAGYSHT